MKIKQSIIKWIFSWAQNRLEPPKPSESVFNTYTDFHCLDDAWQLAYDLGYDTLSKFNKLEINTVIHNLGKDNEYFCLLLIGKEKHEKRNN